MATASNARETQLNDEEDWHLPGLDLMHDFQISLGHWSLIGAVLESLRDANAEVQALSLMQQPNNVALRCRVRAISARRARALADELCARHATAASVEHLMLAHGGGHAGG